MTKYTLSLVLLLIVPYINAAESRKLYDELRPLVQELNLPTYGFGVLLRDVDADQQAIVLYKHALQVQKENNLLAIAALWRIMKHEVQLTNDHHRQIEKLSGRLLKKLLS